MTEWGRKMYVTPGVVVDGKLVTTDLVEINLGIRILLGSSYYEDWESQEMFVRQDPLGNPVDRRHPWNQHTNPKPQKRDLDDKYSWVMSPAGSTARTLWPSTPAAARWHGFGPPPSPDWSTSATSSPPAAACRSNCRRPPLRARSSSSGRSRSGATPWSATGREPTSRRVPRPALCTSLRRPVEIRAGRTKTWEKFTVPQEGIGVGFTEAVRGVLSHHMVIRDGKIANYHPYPPTPWNASPRDSFGTPGPYEDAVQNQPIFEENDVEHFKGIDIMRTVRSFDPACPAGCTCISAEAERWTGCTHQRSTSANSGRDVLSRADGHSSRRLPRRRSGSTP